MKRENFILFTNITKYKLPLILCGIFLISFFLRLYFIFFGYITTDEGIAFYNTKLAYSGLRPFIDYNGWNSLINDYLMGLPQLVVTPTLFTQRVFSTTLALFVFIIALQISRILDKGQIILTAFFLTFASPTYVYFSNLPYSFQTMTFFLMCSLLCISNSLHTSSHFWHDYTSLLFANIAVLIRSQMLPITGLIWLYLVLKTRRINYIIKLSAAGGLTFFLLFLPFVLASWEHTLYALFWPFRAGKILIYVTNTPPRSLTRLISFGLEFLRDYGLLSIVIISGLLANLNSFKKVTEVSRFIILCLAIVTLFIGTAFIHHPADAGYIYPVVPLLAFLAAYFLQKIVGLASRTVGSFMYRIVILLVMSQFLLYPHFKVMQTSPTLIHETPFARLHKLSLYVTEHTKPDDEIITFYLPLAIEANRRVPINLNEGAGSISILDNESAQKYHLITLIQLKNYIASQKAKLIIFPSTGVYFFGGTDIERKELLKLIESKYPQKQEFTEFKTIDGSNAQSLVIYRLPD